MILAFGMVILPQNPSTESGHIPGWNCILSVDTIPGPIAPALALINNLIEIRSDAFKLTHSYQRATLGSVCGIR